LKAVAMMSKNMP